MISPPMAFAREIDSLVFPTAVGPVRTIRGFFHNLSCLYNSLKFLFNFCLCHRNDSGTAMRTIIWIVQSKKLVDQLICLQSRHLMISFDSRFACHCGKSCCEKVKSILCTFSSQIVKHFQKEFFFMESVQICRNCTDTVFPSTKGFNLKTVFPEIFFVWLFNFACSSMFKVTTSGGFRYCDSMDCSLNVLQSAHNLPFRELHAGR